MAKRKRPSSIDETTIDMVFERLTVLINEDPDGDRFTTLLNQLKPRMLGEGGRDFKKPAGDFTFQEVIEAFELKYSSVVSINSTSEFFWAIEDSLKSDFPMTPCLGNYFSLLQSCIKTDALFADRFTSRELLPELRPLQ